MEPEELTATRERSESAESDATSESGGVRGRVRRRATGWFSPKAFLVALALAVGGMFAGGPIPVVGGLVGGLVGVFVAGFALGLFGGRRYVEVGAAGAAAVGASALVDLFAWTLVGVGLPLVAVGVGAGLVAGVLGHYFGRDLRAGVTKSV